MGPSATFSRDEEHPQPDAIRQQLERLLASAPFRKSKRCGPFLRYIATESLAGRAAYLKERRVGMDVFQREPSYDTSTDPIVRTTANEVRKRLAQYYQDPAHEAETRIELVPGSYAPYFRAPGSAHPSGDGSASVEASPAQATLEAQGVGASRFGRRRLWASVFGVSAAAVGAVLARDKVPNAVKAFWGPLWSSADVLTVGVGAALKGVSPDWTALPENTRAAQVGFADAVALGEVVGILQAHGRKWDIRCAEFLTLQDLRRAPAVLIGAFNNAWTLRLQEELRFSLHMDQPSNRAWIRDAQKPDTPPVAYDLTVPYSKRAVDYGVISRFVDPRSQQALLLLAGFEGGATRAAAEFVTQSKHLEALAARAASGWKRKNLQVVFAVDLVNGNIGSPRILAVHFWEGLYRATLGSVTTLPSS
jgi:hypothetical protein